MEGCGWDPDPVCSASPETAEGLRAEARGQLRPQVRGEREGTEPPGDEHGRERETDRHAGHRVKGGGATDSTRVGPASRLCQVPGSGRRLGCAGGGAGRTNKNHRTGGAGTSHRAAKRLAVRRPEETLRTQAASSGPRAW